MAAGAVAAAYPLGPEGQVLVASSTPFAEVALIGDIRRWREWIQTFGERAADRGGQEALLAHLQGRPEAAALLSDAGYAASRTDYEAKLEAIGEAIAGGVLYEEGVAFDKDALLVRTICQLERTHVAVLAAIVSSQGGLLKEHLTEQLPELGPAVPSILAELQALALVGIGRPQPTDRGREFQRQLRSAGRGANPGPVIADFLSKSDRDQLKIPGYQGTSLGLEVVRRYADAATRVGDEELTGTTLRPLGEVEEYMGLVLPEETGGRESSHDLDPGTRPVWVVDPQRSTCPTCGRAMVVRGFVHHMAGGNEPVIMAPGIRCPAGHPLESGDSE